MNDKIIHKGETMLISIDAMSNKKSTTHNMGGNINELIRKIELILIEEGQHDKERFRLGETIKFAPYEVAEILNNHIDEILDVLN